jgi:hypothetical protein
MKFRDFVKNNKKKILEYTDKKYPKVKFNQKELEDLILNDEFLYLWARDEGVRV